VEIALRSAGFRGPDRQLRRRGPRGATDPPTVPGALRICACRTKEHAGRRQADGRRDALGALRASAAGSARQCAGAPSAREGGSGARRMRLTSSSRRRARARAEGHHRQRGAYGRRARGPGGRSSRQRSRAPRRPCGAAFVCERRRVIAAAPPGRPRTRSRGGPRGEQGRRLHDGRGWKRGAAPLEGRDRRSASRSKAGRGREGEGIAGDIRGRVTPPVNPLRSGREGTPRVGAVAARSGGAGRSVSPAAMAGDHGLGVGPWP